jgi:hypothetical protein
MLINLTGGSKDAVLECKSLTLLIKFGQIDRHEVKNVFATHGVPNNAALEKEAPP